MVSRKQIIQDYFKESLKMNAETMSKDFADNIEIQNIAPNFTRYIYGIQQFKRSTTEDVSKLTKEMLAIFDAPKQEIESITEKEDTVEITISFSGVVNKDLGIRAPYKNGEIVTHKSRSIFKFNNENKIILIQNHIN